MSCDNVITVQDLETDKKHSTFYREVITGKVGGTGADIDSATNAVTGQTQTTLPKVLSDAESEFDQVARDAEIEFERVIGGMGYARVGTFKAGATLNNARQTMLWDVADGGDGQEYGWGGLFPKVVPANSTPAGAGGVGEGKWVSRFDPELKSALAAPSGAGLVGGVPVPVADARFSGGASVSNTDNKNAFKSAISSGETVRVQRGSYLTSAPISTSGGSRVVLEGDGPETKLKIAGNGSMLSVNASASASIRKLQFDMTQPAISGTKHGLIFIDQQNLVVQEVEISGIATEGSGLITYSATGDQIPYALVDGVRVLGNRADSTNTNGILLVDNVFSTITGSYVSGVASYALELKNKAENNIISDSFANNNQNGLYYGSDVVGKNPSYNISHGVIIKDCQVGYTPGGGSNNLTSSILFDNRGVIPTSSSAAIRVDSISSSIYGGHFVGDGNVVRYNASAKNNYTQISVQPTSSSYLYVVYEDGSQRNALEISHPGDLVNSIRSKSPRPSGVPVSGPQANPVWCHATGEYLGSFSNGWLWQHAEINNTRASNHKWRFEGAGDTFLAISSDGLGVTGYLVNTPTGNRDLAWVEGGSYWRLTGGGYEVRFYSSTIRPSADNTMDFGTATYRGRTAYFATGTINTSDAREKSSPLSIDDAVLDAWGDVQLVAFQWLNAIQQKGEDVARWHFGVIAQQVRDAFSDHGLDGARYGLLCHDEWEAEPEVVDDEGNVTSPAIAAGDRWGIRPDQCLFLEAAYQRRNYQRLAAKIEALESKQF